MYIQAMETHLPVQYNTPNEAQGQFVVPIHNICPSYVYQIHLSKKSESN